MNANRILIGVVATAGLALAACSRVPACNDPDVLKQVVAQAQAQAADHLKQRFTIPFLSPAATQALTALFSPDSISVSDMRTASIDKELGQRRCEAVATYRYATEGRVDHARQALEHGAVTGQTLSYMLDGEPYLSAIRKLAAEVTGPLAYTTQKTDDGHLRVEMESRDLPLF